MDRRPKQAFLQRRHTDGQESHEKMLSITNYQQNTSQNYKEISPHTCQNGHHQKVCKQCFNGNRGTCIFFNYGFLRVYAQQWNMGIWWVIWWLQSYFFKDSAPCCLQWLYICIPTNSIRELPFPHSLFIISCLQTFDDAHSYQCEMIPYCIFDLHFTKNEQH